MDHTHLLDCAKSFLSLGDVRQHGGKKATGAVDPMTGHRENVT